MQLFPHKIDTTLVRFFVARTARFNNMGDLLENLRGRGGLYFGTSTSSKKKAKPEMVCNFTVW